MKNRTHLLLLLPILCSCGPEDYSAEFSRGQGGLNRLRVEAPDDHYVLIYSVVPSEKPRKPYRVGGKSLPGRRGTTEQEANCYPPSGTVDGLQLETHTKISGVLNPAATAAIPENEQLLKHCGVYVFLTRNKNAFDTIDSIVANWNRDEGPGSSSP